ncbi:hypothetical protein GCM10022248_83660 [Nonomuraea soli]
MTEDDDMLENDLRRAADLMDPVPAALLQSAVEAFALRSLAAELAALSFDSLAETTTVRSGYGTRLLSFDGATHTVDVELSFTDGSGRLLGSIHPPEETEVSVERPEHTVVLRTDPFGRFSCRDLAPGPLSLRCRVGGAELVTEWITV